MYTPQKPWRSEKYLKQAKGQECTLQIPGVCIGGTETTVACHSPLKEDREGTKAPDFCVAWGCRACHDTLDRRAKISAGHDTVFGQFITDEDQRFYFHRGMVRTLGNAISDGVFTV